MKNCYKLKEIVRNAFKDSYEVAGGCGFRYYHLISVVHIAKEICEKEGISSDNCNIVQSAALFHDIGKTEWIEEDGLIDGSLKDKKGALSHEKASAIFVRQKLKEYFSSDEIEEIAQIIETHDHPEDLLAKVLHDADELAEMGVMNVLRIISYSVYKHRDMQATINYWFNVDCDRHREKANKMFLQSSKDMACTRIAETDKYFKKLQSQIQLDCLGNK